MARDVQIKIGATDAASNVIKKVSSSVGRLDQALLKIGTGSIAVATAALAGLGAAAAAGFGLAIATASRAQEIMGKFSVVFGESADEVETWSKATARAMGVSRDAMAGMLSGLQDLFVPMGLAPDMATEMSKTLSQLAVDLGSFNNLDSDRVMTDLMAAMTGSGETMKKYGVIVDEAAVKQELLNMKLDPKAATNAEKAQARLTIIMRGTTAAQGDAIRTQDSFANSLKSVKAEITNLMGALGTPFLNVLAGLLQSWKGTIQGITDSIANADWAGAMNIATLKMKIEMLKGLDAIGDLIRDKGGGILKEAFKDAFTGAGIFESLIGQAVGGAVGGAASTRAAGGLEGLAKQLQEELNAAIAQAASSGPNAADTYFSDTATMISTANTAGEAVGTAFVKGVTRKYKQDLRADTIAELMGSGTSTPAVGTGLGGLANMFGLKGGGLLGNLLGMAKGGVNNVLDQRAETFSGGGSLQATQGRLLSRGGTNADEMLQEVRKQGAQNATFRQQLQGILDPTGWKVTIQGDNAFTMKKVP